MVSINGVKETLEKSALQVPTRFINFETRENFACYMRVNVSFLLEEFVHITIPCCSKLLKIFMSGVFTIFPVLPIFFESEVIAVS